MPDVVVVSDAPWVHDELKAVLDGPDVRIRALRRGKEALPALQRQPADLLVLDMQIGNMGGVATCLDVRLEEGVGRLPHVPVLLLLDREADVFLAARAGAEGWITKPLEPLRLRRAVSTLLSGGTYHGGSTRSEVGPMLEPTYVPTPDSSPAGAQPASGPSDSIVPTGK